MASRGFIELLRLADLARARKSGRRGGQEFDWQGVVFEIGGQRLVAPMGQVSEVLSMPEYTSLPLVKPWMLGIANIRGRLLPLTDLSHFLQVPSRLTQMSQLVLVINNTADRVSQSSDQTQLNAVELAEASEHQAQEIAGVSAAINEMTVSIDQVSDNASESATVAQRSVAIAYNGAEVVQRSIEGMNVIRDQIQETSKRIKRLGESSQEIGDIVGLINDIADQTNVLALNAAIQASMAGEAGRGFAVVADEVQRLAERSANATKQIETLVKTIQTDTNEAVMSMESTTSEVVRGARLAKDAGEALEEVQSVSNTLADLIQNISNAALQQAESAGHISHTMNIIQDITSQTSSGTMATARSIGELSEMAAALQASVTGFTVSNDDELLDDNAPYNRNTVSEIV